MSATPLYAKLGQDLGFKTPKAIPCFAEMRSQQPLLLRLDNGAALLDYVNSRLSEHSDCASSSSSSSNQDSAGQAGAALLQGTAPRAAAPLLKAVSVPVQLMSVGGQWQVRLTFLRTADFLQDMLRRLRLHLRACCTAVLCTSLLMLGTPWSSSMLCCHSSLTQLIHTAEGRQ